MALAEATSVEDCLNFGSSECTVVHFGFVYQSVEKSNQSLGMSGSNDQVRGIRVDEGSEGRCSFEVAIHIDGNSAECFDCHDVVPDTGRHCCHARYYCWRPAAATIAE